MAHMYCCFECIQIWWHHFFWKPFINLRQLNKWHCLSVCRSVCRSQLTIRACNHYNHYNHYRDSDLDLDWERLSGFIVTWWHSWLLLTNCEIWIMTLRVSDSQSERDLDSIRNSCDIYWSKLVHCTLRCASLNCIWALKEYCNMPLNCPIDIPIFVWRS